MRVTHLEQQFQQIPARNNRSTFKRIMNGEGRWGGRSGEVQDSRELAQAAFDRVGVALACVPYKEGTILKED
jgi:hypothetical protein